ncbi:membrane protein insertase YidC [Tessaracoccus sp. HF-7]|nr:membrane protein insertase YidC [Tessaracoccus caeni]MDF1488108.1 membrane protein insertase YidC [Tessaracoccus caeni]
MGALSTMMQPIYWAISGILVAAYHLWGVILALPTGAAWTLAIVSLTVVVRTAMIPLFVKQINSSRNMQLLQPQAQALQKKYGHDRERLGQETMKLYQSEGVNPMASCFPLLIQMPIFLALFRVLEGVASGSIRGKWLKDNPDLVASLNGASFLGAGLSDRVFPLTPFGSTQVVGIIMVVVMVAVLFITQLQLMRKNMPPEALTGPMAQQQKIMLYAFPVIFAFSATVLPIGVLLYWLTSNTWTMAQQGLLIRNNPAPNTPAYIDWEERMRSKGKDPVKIMEERREKRRKVKTNKTQTRTVAAGRNTTAAAAVTTNAENTSGASTEAPKVSRQQVTRQTTRRTEDGKQVVSRQQPKQQSRSQRKKK